VYYSGVVSTFSYSGRSVARQQLLATSLRSDNRAPLGAGNLCAPDPLLAKSGFGGLNNINTRAVENKKTVLFKRKTTSHKNRFNYERLSRR
jgi:hypothetical protein